MTIHKFRKGESLWEIWRRYAGDGNSDAGWQDTIADYIFEDSGKARKGVGDVMGGNVLELESDRLIQRGEEQQALKTARLMLMDGKLLLEEISRFSGLEPERIKQLKREENL